jgi:hypothetical protein
MRRSASRLALIVSAGVALAASWFGCGGRVGAHAPSAPDAATSDTSCRECEAGSLDRDTGAPEPDVAVRDAASDEQADATQPEKGPCSAVIPGPCDPLSQCGCPAPYACRVDQHLDGEVSACQFYGDSGPWGSCDQTRDCPPGYGCFSSGACQKYCLKTGDCEGVDPYRKCQLYDGSSPLPGTRLPPLEPYGVCNRLCDPANPQSDAGDYQACGSGMHCDPSVTGETECDEWFDPTRGVDPGAPCLADRECPAGYACREMPSGAGSDAGEVCLRWCHVGGVGCPAGSRCVSDGDYAGSQALGFCVK